MNAQTLTSKDSVEDFGTNLDRPAYLMPPS